MYNAMVLAGANIYKLAENCFAWSDPLGLEKCRVNSEGVKKLYEEAGKLLKNMKFPHLHHIVREKAPKNWPKEFKRYIKKSHKIIKKAGIDRDADMKNFVVAPLGEGNHSQAAAKIVHDELVVAAKKGSAAVSKTLKSLGERMSTGSILG